MNERKKKLLVGEKRELAIQALFRHGILRAGLVNEGGVCCRDTEQASVMCLRVT
jgi:hypothetical protein